MSKNRSKQPLAFLWQAVTSVSCLNDKTSQSPYHPLKRWLKLSTSHGSHTRPNLRTTVEAGFGPSFCSALWMLGGSCQWVSSVLFAWFVEFFLKKNVYLVLIISKIRRDVKMLDFWFTSTNGDTLGTSVFSHGHDGSQLSMAETFGQIGAWDGSHQSSYSYMHISVGNKTHGGCVLSLPFHPYPSLSLWVCRAMTWSPDVVPLLSQVPCLLPHL